VRPSLLLAILALLPSSAVLADSVRSLGSIALAPCTLATPGSPATVAAFCGGLEVAEDRAAAGGRRIELALALVPSRARHPRPDPVFMLAGGPGQSARESFPAVAAAFVDVLRERDVILVDQRGTGGSNALDCGAPQDDDGLTSIDADSARRSAERCLAALDADPRHYTTSDAVRDLEAVREAIAAPHVNLVGISYGTRVALEYLRRHPQRTRTVVLDGVVPPGLALGSEHARNLEVAVDGQFALCEADDACRREFGAPRVLLDRLLADLDAQPRTVRYRDPLTDAVHEDAMTRATVANLVRLYAYSPLLAASLPRTLAEAAAGRPEVLMAQARLADAMVGEQIASGLQLSVICTEDADRLRADPADADTLMGTAFVASLLAQCEVWPRGARPGDFNEPVRSDVPALLLSGEFDPVTPPRYAETVLEYLPNGRHLVGRGQGHNLLPAGCVPQLVSRFIASADAAALDAGCLDRLAPPPPVLGAHGWDP